MTIVDPDRPKHCKLPPNTETKDDRKVRHEAKMKRKQEANAARETPKPAHVRANVSRKHPDTRCSVQQHVKNKAAR